MRLDFQFFGSINWASKPFKRRLKNKHSFFSQILFRMFKSFKKKAAFVKDDTPERLFQGWIGRRHE